MDVLTAWNVVNCHTYFTRPAYDEEGNIYSFYNDFHGACEINPTKHNGEIVWVAELGSWCIEDKLFYHDCSVDMIANSYEELIIKIAEWLVDKYGEDDLYYYFWFDEDNCKLIKNENGNYEINKNNSHWMVDELLDRIRSYETE